MATCIAWRTGQRFIRSERGSMGERSLFLLLGHTHFRVRFIPMFPTIPHGEIIACFSFRAVYLLAIYQGL